MYEEYLTINNLNNNDILMLFLAELRYLQLSYKITNNSVRRNTERKTISFDSNYIPNKVVSKWYNESMIEKYISREAVEALNKELAVKLEDNRRRMIASENSDVMKKIYKY